MMKRALSILLALMLCLTILPTAALAEVLQPENPATMAEPQPTAPLEPKEDSVAEVQAMIDALPTEETLTAEDYETVLAAYEAYAALSEEEQARVTGAERLEELLAWFNNQTAPYTLSGSTTEQAASVIKITPEGSEVSYYYDTVAAALRDCLDQLGVTEHFTMTLLKDATVEPEAGFGYVYLSGLAVFDLGGHTLTSTGMVIIQGANQTELTIKNGTVQTTSAEAQELIHQNDKCELYLEDVTLVGPVSDGQRRPALYAPYHAIIRGNSTFIGGVNLETGKGYYELYSGTFTTGAAAGVTPNSYSIFTQDGTNVSILNLLKGSTVFANSAGDVINAAEKCTWITVSKNYQGYALTEDVTIVAHVSHTYDPATGQCPCGETCSHSAVDMETGKCQACQKRIYEAKIGDSGYATLEAAMAAAGSDATITLLADINRSGTNITVESGSFLLNLNGKNVILLPVGKEFIIQKNAAVTIVGKGSTVGASVNVYGMLTVKSGSFTREVTIQQGGAAELSGGYFKKISVPAGRQCRELLAAGYALKDSSVGNGPILPGTAESLSDVSVVSHTRHTYDPATGQCLCGEPCPHETLYTDNDGHTEGACTICGKQAAIAKIGTTYYRDIAALNEAAKGVTGHPTLTILCDITGNLKLVKSELTLEAGSHTINGALQVNNSTVTIQGGTYAKNAIFANSVVTLEGGDYAGAVNISGSASNMTMKGSTFQGTVAMRGQVTVTENAVFNNTVSISTGTATVENASITKAVTVNADGNLVVKGGTLTSATVKANGSAHFQGGSISGTLLVETDGELTASAGSFGTVAFQTGGKGVLSGGYYSKITGWNSTLVENFLAEGYAYKRANTWPAYAGLKEIRDVSVAYVPLQSIALRLTAGEVDLTYGYQAGEAPQAAASVVQNGTASVTYLWELTDENNTKTTLSSTTGTGTLPVGLAAGSYQLTCTATCEGYSLCSAPITITVAKAAPGLTRQPAGRENLVYCFTEQTLITAGTVTGGEWQYSLNREEGYSTALPTGTDAGQYTVWYKVVGDANHLDTEPASLQVVIVPLVVTAPRILLDGRCTYNGQPQRPAVTLMADATH